ncbi:MAG: RnfABCDGE type electron transport complex subunit D, partial [Aeromonadaceae bacterium]
SMKTQLGMGRDLSTIHAQPQFGQWAGVGWEWVNLAFLAGGLFLILIGTIAWQIPTAMLLSLTLCAAIAHGLQPEQFMAPLLQLLSGATMLGAFFIATDPVTAATTPRGRLIYGALIGLLVFIIRSWGGYPDAVAFSVLLVNILVPLIDSCSRPAIYGK